MGSQGEVSAAFLLARMPGKHGNSCYFLRQLEIPGFRGFKLMEINVATAVFQVLHFRPFKDLPSMAYDINPWLK